VEVEVQKTGKEMRAELVPAGVDNQPLPSRLDRLRSLAANHGIEATKKVLNLEEGSKTIPELRKDIEEKGHTLDPRRTYRSTDLREIAGNLDIPLVYKRRKVLEGWCGKTKGLFQILWERGFIDASKVRYDSTIDKVSSTYYIKNGNKNHDFDKKGNIKEAAKARVLIYLLSTCADFANEVSDLQFLAQQIGMVSIIFTPKYHCELAG
jgi:hypothetical protein